MVILNTLNLVHAITFLHAVTCYYIVVIPDTLNQGCANFFESGPNSHKYNILRAAP